MAGKRKVPARDDSSHGGQKPERAGGIGSALRFGEAGRRALQQWSDARGAPNHRQAVPNALRRPASDRKK